MTDGLHPHRNGSWRNALIGAFGGIMMLFAGWMLNEVATERRALEGRINALEKQQATDGEALRGLRAQVYELRRLHDQEKREP